MKLQHLVLAGFVSISTVPLFVSFPVNACQPAPDNPNGCDGINGGKIIFPRPPICLNCPYTQINSQDHVVLPAVQLKDKKVDRNSILINRKQFDQFPQDFNQSKFGSQKSPLSH